MKLAILAVSRNRPDLAENLITRIQGSVSVPHDVFLAEWGTEPGRLTTHSNLWFADSPSRGECFGYSLALQAARLQDDYDYLWILRSDVEFDAGSDVAARMIRILEKHPRMAMLAPKCGGAPAAEGTWRAVASCGLLGLMLRTRAVESVGFLNADFRACTGAVDELAYRLYGADWFAARTDGVCVRVAESSPFDSLAAAVAGQRFAYEYFRTNYGESWDEEFWMAVQGHGIERNLFAEHRAAWRAAIEEEGREPGAEALEPYPLATDATHVLFSWPRYDSATELDALFEAYGRPVLGRRDVCLALRHDAREDGSQTAAIAALEESCSRVLGDAADLEVLLVDDPLALRDWARLGRSVTAVLPLPSSAREPRLTCLRAMDAPIVRNLEELAAIVPDLALPRRTLERYTKAELDHVDWKLVEEIKALHPWPLPVRIGNLAVVPGQGTDVDAELIERHTARRAARLVADVAKRFEWKGKSILELGCGCGYWAARYAEAGAGRVVGVDSCERGLRQAKLYWSRNGFLGRERVRFLRGDLEQAATWDEISSTGPHDVTICAGIPADLRDLAQFLRRAAEVTRDALLLELDAERQRELVVALEELGFLPEVLPVVPALTGSGVRLASEGPGSVTVFARRARIRIEHGALRPRAKAAARSLPVAPGAKSA